MVNTSKENEMTTGAATIIGIFVVFPLLYFEIVDFIWTGLLIWIFGTAIFSGIMNEIEKKKAEEDEDFDLAGLGALIWKSDEGVPVNFSYTDAKGKKSDRKVVLHKIFKDSKTRFYFEGYCQLRRAERTFDSEKIELLHDTNGEILELPEFINNIVGYEAFGSTEVRAIEEK
jgi:hypothetical protein